MIHTVEALIRRIPGWETVGAIHVEPLYGLTNTNYAVTVHGERFVLRISGDNVSSLGIDRHHEIDVLRAMDAAGIGAQVYGCLLPEGHLVTRRIDGVHLDLETYRKPETIRRIVSTVRRMHRSEPVRAVFSPFRRVERYAGQAQAMQVGMPHDFDRIAVRMAAIEREQNLDPSSWKRLCHNDLFSVNVIDDGRIRFIDWEFSGMNDIYYDLATLTYAYDSPDTLSLEQIDFMLECYFGDVTPGYRARLSGMRYMVLCFSAFWGLLQYGLQRRGLVRGVEGFDFMQYATETFEVMRQV